MIRGIATVFAAMLMVGSFVLADEGGGSGVNIIPLQGHGFAGTLALGPPFEDPNTGAIVRDGWVAGRLYGPATGWDVPFESITVPMVDGALTLDVILILRRDGPRPEPNGRLPWRLVLDMDGTEGDDDTIDTPVGYLDGRFIGGSLGHGRVTIDA
jgi:hypothetical protein